MKNSLLFYHPQRSEIVRRSLLSIEKQVKILRVLPFWLQNILYLPIKRMIARPVRLIWISDGVSALVDSEESHKDAFWI